MHRALAVRDIGTVYRLLREMGISQRQIADLTGQSQSEVSEIINGRQVIAYDVLKRIAEGLGIPHGHMGLAQCNGQLDEYPVHDDDIDLEMDDDMISRRVLGSVSVALLGDAVLDGPVMQSGRAVLGERGQGDRQSRVGMTFPWSCWLPQDGEGSGGVA
jgi:transcriptional regulator with XRE-family HTH domain